MTPNPSLRPKVSNLTKYYARPTSSPTSSACGFLHVCRFSVSDMASKAEAAELVKPGPDKLELIGAWLVHHGIRSSSVSTTHGGAWPTVPDVLVSQAK